MAQGYGRNDNRPEMCFKGIWIKDHLVKDFTLDFCPSVFLFYFWCSLFNWDSFSPFFFSFSCFCSFLLVLFLCLHISAFSRMSSVLFFWAPKLDCLWSWQDFSCTCLQYEGWSLVRVNERNYQAQKGTTSG